MLVPQNLESAVIEQRIQIGDPEIDQMARHVDAVPALAEQQELPAGGVGDLDDQPAVGPQQLVRGVEIAGRIVEMLQHVEHGDGGATGGREGSARKRRAHGRNAGAAPRDVGRIERKIEADHA